MFSKWIIILLFLSSAQIDDSVASLVIAQLLFLQSESNNKPIHMYINSPGKMVSEDGNREKALKHII